MGVNPNRISSPASQEKASARRGKPAASAQVSGGVQDKSAEGGESQRKLVRAGAVPARTLAQQTVTAVIAGMVVATAAATAVGFWLSYDGLHAFALHARLRGAEAWAWPGSVDLFILAGESGVTLAALRRQTDRAAWVYLAIGFAASVCANILQVDTAALAWTRYAVAATPPIAAMLALAALLRQVYRSAEHRTTPEPAAEIPVPEVPSALNGHAEKAAEIFREDLAAGKVPGVRRIRAGLGVGQPRAQEVREYLSGLANGHAT
jgi:hypothetical protein